MITLSPDWLNSPEILKVFEAFQTAGQDVRAVGGCVRDSLLNRPVTDVDMATPALPDEVMQLAETAGLKAIPTGLAHGTVTVVSDRQPFEITTLRKDIETDGRHAVVAFSTDWEEDAARRDFTMNALYLDKSGRLTDFFGGVADARAGRVRFIGKPSDRIKEDYLRILRFFRFDAHYGKTPIDPEALADCKAHASGLKELSGERVQTEFLKLLEAGRSPTYAQLLNETGASDAIFGWKLDFEAAKRLDGFQMEHYTRFPAAAFLAVLVAPDAVGAADRMKLSNALRAEVLSYLDMPLPSNLASSEEARRMLFYKHGANNALLAVMVQGALERHELAWTELEEIAWAAKDWSAPRFPVTGQDVLEAGLSPGPAVGETLRLLEDWWCLRAFEPDRAALLTKLDQLVQAP